MFHLPLSRTAFDVRTGESHSGPLVQLVQKEEVIDLDSDQ